MHSVVGLFSTHQAARQTVNALDLPSDRITVVAPGPLEAEDKGIGSALGGAVGGAIGAAAGSTLGTAAAASMVLPGVGPVLVTGIIGALLLGAGGAVAGASVGDRIEEAAEHDPAHNPSDLFYYHEALRRGRVIVMALADTPAEAASLRATMESGGGHALDVFREDWWRGIRESETEFAGDENEYRRGFEMALTPENRDRPLDDDENVTAAWREGYRRGHEYYRKFYLT